MCHSSPLPTNANALDVATDFVPFVFKLQGLPETLISNRDAKFTSLVWQDIMRLCGTTISMSTSYHPQTDGQTKRMNQVQEDVLRHYIAPNQANWDELLPCAKFAINNAVSSTTGDTPFR